MEYRYWADIRAEADGYLVTFPDVPEAITQENDLADAKLSASAEALGLALRGYLARGKPLPHPTAKGGALAEIAVDPGDAVKLAVIEAFQASGLSKSELVRRLGKAESEARRLLDPDHPTRLDTLTAALAALGKQVIISVRDAA